MNKYLLLRLSGTSLYFGTTRIDHHHYSEELPLKSMIVGLIANALGYDRSEYSKLETLQDSLTYAVRIDKQGFPTPDYQSVDIDVAKSENFSAKTEKHLKYNVFLSDGIYLVAISLDHPALTLDDVLYAINNPARPLFIGHKNCIPDSRIGLGIHESESFYDLFSKYPPLKHWGFSETKENFFVWLPVTSELDFQNLSSLDQIKEFTDEFDHHNRIYGGQRFMVRKRISIPIIEDNNVVIEDTPIIEDTPVIIEDTPIIDDTLKSLFTLTLKVSKERMEVLSIMHKASSKESKDISYEAHVLLKCLFGISAPNCFSIQDVDSHFVSISLYSPFSLEKMKEIATKKNINHYVNKHSLNAVLWEESSQVLLENFDTEQQFNFEIDLVPIRRSNGKDRDAYDSHLSFITSLPQDDPRVSLSKEEVYKKWLLEKFNNNSCIQLTSVKVLTKDDSLVLRKFHKKKELRAFSQPSVKFIGSFTISDSLSFLPFLFKGIGRQLSFGIGMFRFS